MSSLRVPQHGDATDPQGVPRDRVVRTVTPDSEVQKRLYALMVLMKAADDRLSKGIGTGEFMCVYWPSRGQEAIAAAMGVTSAGRRPAGHHLPRAARPDRQGRAAGGDLRRDDGPHRRRQPRQGRHHAHRQTRSGRDAVDRDRRRRAARGGRVWRWPPSARGSTASPRSASATARPNTGSFHEAANMAALWDLPVVFVCQNNQYAEMTPTTDTMKIEHVADRAAGYGMPGVRVDGNDPLAVAEALADAVAKAPQRRRPHLPRVRHVPVPRPLLRRSDGVHPRGAAGGGEGGRPGAALPQAARRHRGVHRRRADRHRRRRPGRRRVGAAGR